MITVHSNLTWALNDLFIIITSTALAMRFRQISERLTKESNVRKVSFFGYAPHRLIRWRILEQLVIVLEGNPRGLRPPGELLQGTGQSNFGDNFAVVLPQHILPVDPTLSQFGVSSVETQIHLNHIIRLQIHISGAREDILYIFVWLSHL